MAVFSPIVTLLTSPRTTAPYQTLIMRLEWLDWNVATSYHFIFYAYLDFLPMVTFPMREADGATNVAISESTGATPSTATNRVDGTSRSVYFATSSWAPMESSATLLHK